ncbi:MAG: hypothetical protein BRD26_09945 [Bacteroidetes bacterium QH_1_64_81]|nr:MAG: hypothetical protein BRD26_09945 [Bacteroidetes bacterium QH_1_64_81]
MSTRNEPSSFTPPTFTVDPDIRTAATPPSALYHESAYFAHQQDADFARSWHLVGDARELATTGSVKPFTLLEGCLDEPLFLIRDEEQTLHCLSNVCTHRGNILVEGEGHLPGTSIQCRYHGRRFGMDGCFLSMPGFEEAEDFPSPEDDLPAAALETWGPFVFCSLDPAMPFDDWIAPTKSGPIHRQGSAERSRSTNGRPCCKYTLSIKFSSSAGDRPRIRNDRPAMKQTDLRRQRGGPGTGDGHDGPGAGEGHHHHGQQHGHPLRRQENQHRRHPGPRRLRGRGGAYAPHGRWYHAAGGRGGGAAPADPLRGAEGAGARSPARRRSQQDRP